VALLLRSAEIQPPFFRFVTLFLGGEWSGVGLFWQGRGESVEDKCCRLARQGRAVGWGEGGQGRAFGWPALLATPADANGNRGRNGQGWQPGRAGLDSIQVKPGQEWSGVVAGLQPGQWEGRIGHGIRLARHSTV